jgi:hypothetical protein
MPPNLFYMLRKYLNWLRLERLVDELRNQDLAFLVDESRDTGYYSVWLYSANYRHTFFGNFTKFKVFTLMFLIIWLLLSLYEVVRSINGKPKEVYGSRWERVCNNFLLRYFYELYFEICLVIILTIDLAQGKKDQEFSFVLAAILCVLSLLFLLFSCSRFFCRGPYIRRFWIPGTSMKSFREMRPFDNEFNAYNKALYL